MVIGNDDDYYLDDYNDFVTFFVNYDDFHLDDYDDFVTAIITMTMMITAIRMRKMMMTLDLRERGFRLPPPPGITDWDLQLS